MRTIFPLRKYQNVIGWWGGIEVRCLHDLTRGGLASVLVEIAEAARLQIDVDENAVPVREDVQGECEMRGLDPFYVANDGRFIAFVRQRAAPNTRSWNQVQGGHGIW